MAETSATTTRTRTACSYCGVGCGVVVETKPDAMGNPLIAKVSGDKLHPTNFGRLCTKGATHAEMMAAVDGRMSTAYIRPQRGGEPTPVPVDDAVTEAAERIRAIVDEHGPDAVALYVSGQMSIEAQYLSNKLAKGFLRTVHIESNSRLCMASAGTGYKQSLGADGPPGSYEDFDVTDLFFVIGSNMADCHPILYLRMADRLKAGAKLIVVDPRRTTTAEKADLFLQIKPGTDLALLNGLLHLLVESGDIDETFIAEHTEGWEAMGELLADYPPARVAEITGLAEDDIRTAARMIAHAKSWMSCWTMGLNQSTHGTWSTNAICNLHLATGAICTPGSGPMSLTGQPNAMGGREMGYMGPGLPGQRAVLAPADREFCEQEWGLEPGTIRSDVGPGTIELFERLGTGDVKACWIICTNPVASVANRKTVINGLENAELVIAQDAYTETATNAYADILLPATLWSEADAVMVNSERNMTLLKRSTEPPGDARPDWQLIADVACALGFADDFSYKSSEEIFDEIRRFSNLRTGYDLRGVSYERLRREPVQWPAPPADDNHRHPIRYLNDGVSQDLFVAGDGHTPRLAFPTPSRRAQFFARPHMDAREMPDDEYPIVLNTGRLQHQWHTMTKTGKVAKLNKLNPKPFVEIHPEDAQRLAIRDGVEVEIASRRGRAVLPAVVTDRVRPGGCFVPFHWNDEHGEYLTINAVTNDATDAASLQPEFKACAVALRPVEVPVQVPAAAPAMGNLHAMLGLDDFAPPTPTENEKYYLAGLLAGIGAEPVGVPTVPASAPLSESMRMWVDGVLAGMFSRSGEVAPAVLTETVEDTKSVGVLVLWASQTGNAEEFAAHAVSTLTDCAIPVRSLGMDDAAPADLVGIRDLLVVTSTFGDGGPPDNGADFWSQLDADDAPRLDGVRYAVLGMGDPSYDNFCGHAKNIDARLENLGARRVRERVECEPDDTEPADAWLAEMVTLLGADDDGGAVMPSGPEPFGAGAGPAPGGVATLAPPTPARVITPAAPPVGTRANPVLACLVRNELLTSADSAKEVRRFGFDLSGTAVTYAAGDSLGIYPTNTIPAVDNWLTATGLNGDRRIDLDGVEITLAEALRTRFDISKITPDLLKFVAARNSDPELARLLRRDNKNDLAKFMWGRHAPDLLRAFPVQADFIEWRSVLKKLAARQYSISSSPRTTPSEVQLTVSVVRYPGDDGAPRDGVCSTFLADRAADDPVPVYVQSAPAFKPPEDPAGAMIMIGPGTGIAPFRGFLHDRRAQGHTGKNWLFFGDQHAAHNFYYRSELEDMFRDGFLNRLDLAFSRDQRERIYVQHRMIEHGAELWSWLQDGAHLYVCGDASRMARDVDEALLEIAEVHGKLDRDAALAFKKRLTSEKRYLRDVY
ncbi:bifunctional nitrate reductase/sulfite reductase flavoprotein subunit alpha [Aldersonia sp. NBC_00410]|uniref:bifunctional nitrate reductase/sulfite reductase flavoprotein subunit alpha n=1 Tax=Aldersonia sp. NBC_00410 TaxID=2975954 RepID=UPI00225765A0|nr:bifunctional nitrate reductase/sulfite reductase flavoprotein subunit alpha [Aldersonia sp. NBC_00410]MCX5041724.1 bifunctional nitrate reductase/sulfite reductase flavoprotein subunit alpha [Aldersonia sp. NBC_00410]